MINGKLTYIQLQPGEKNDIKHKKYYQWPKYWLGGFVDTKPSSKAKWLIPKNKASIFQKDIKTDLKNLGGIQQAEKKLETNVLGIKALVKKQEIIKNFV